MKALKKVLKRTKIITKALPCYCGDFPQVKTYVDCAAIGIDEFGELVWLDEAPFYYCVCGSCGRSYSFFPNRTPREAIISWNEHVCWEEIPTYIPDGKVDERFADIVLTDEDKAVIRGLRKAIKESDSLVGYCPYEREDVICRFKNSLDSQKYRLGTVFEHYGLGSCSLYRKRQFPE